MGRGRGERGQEILDLMRQSKRRILFYFFVPVGLGYNNE